ncbi:hypothetical protein QU487_21595, partial [Crenobacter sp. SG2305]|nr:hypothetical protein [Crenobacter sp. SG2305]
MKHHQIRTYIIGAMLTAASGSPAWALDMNTASIKDLMDAGVSRADAQKIVSLQHEQSEFKKSAASMNERVAKDNDPDQMHMARPDNEKVDHPKMADDNDAHHVIITKLCKSIVTGRHIGTQAGGRTISPARVAFGFDARRRSLAASF